MSEQYQQRLHHLMALWEQEQRAVHQRFVEQRKELTLRERVERGLALKNLSIVETDAALGERTLLWLSQQGETDLDNLQIGPGSPVRLWWDDPDSEEAVLGVVSRRRNDRIGVVVDANYPDILEEGGFHLDGDEPQTTFERGKKAIQLFLEAEKRTDAYRLCQIFYGQRGAEFSEEKEVTWLDTSLNEPQQKAVLRCLAAKDVALVYGPPGTGKTRTLVEVIRQAVARGERVLATAASNAAVDNIGERLATENINVVRIGHPARVSSKMETRTLDALVEATGAYELSRKWIIEANNLRRKINNRADRHGMKRSERRELMKEVNSLYRDARKQRRSVQQATLSNAAVVCATATGCDSSLLRNHEFDLVVLDEATQAPDPVALIALSRAPKAVLAGDPQQLPPTVICMEAERNGLGTTLFERLAKRDNGDFVRLLTIQYRMHETIMAYPSQSMYNNKLVAAPEVKHHQLTDLEGVLDDPLRPTPLIFLDTAGKGWEETRSSDDPSTSNTRQAERTVAEVHRLLGRGVSPQNIAIITPYNAQVRILREMLGSKLTQTLEVGSVDGFQGREKEAIVIDLVRSNDDGEIGFLQDKRRMNVALTRAKRFLLVLGDSATLGMHSYYAAFLESAESTNSWRSAWDDDAPPFDITHDPSK